ncbi:hypothetical protein HDU76_004598 [Blyttiomyces sp. JEL0837]|nr:hypothetical protein HDU76_004598 [Blyttiomyces sp. JEL0837]
MDMARSDYLDQIPKLLINIPMRQFWKEELEDALNELGSIKLLFVAGTCGHFELFEYLCEESQEQQQQPITAPKSQISLSKVYSYIIILAAERGFKDIIQYILTNLNVYNNQTQPQPQTQNPRSSIFLSETYTTAAIYEAFKHGYIDIIKLLLPLPNNDPTLQEHHMYLPEAVHHLHVIKFLLSEIPGIDINTTVQRAFYRACAEGAVETVTFLLSTFPEIVVQLFSISLEDSAEYGHFNVVRLLIDYHPTFDLSGALEKAAFEGHLNIVKMLLDRIDVWPWPESDYVIEMATEYGYAEVVEMLNEAKKTKTSGTGL